MHSLPTRAARLCIIYALWLLCTLGQLAPTLQANRHQADNFNKALTWVSTSHVQPQTTSKLYQRAMDGMLRASDPHSAYLGPKSLQALKETLNNKVVGIGVHLQLKEHYAQIISVLPKSPAEQAGIAAGDKITHINDRQVKDMSFDQLIDSIRGKQDTSVAFTMITNHGKSIKTIKIIRKKLDIRQVKYQTLSPHIGLIRISLFNQSTTTKVKHGFLQLKKQNPHLRAVIIDLRNNPGGSLTSAIQTTNLFLQADKLSLQKKIVSIHSRKTSKHHYAIGDDISKNIPLFVLINAGSASASEIMAAALTDHKRAVIIGESSFGKGSVQSILPLDATSAIKLTTALYRSPSGSPIQGHGITPHIQLITGSIDPKKTPTVRERQLKNAMIDAQKKRKQPPVFLPHHVTQNASLAQHDFALYQTLSAVQALIVKSKPLKHADLFAN